MRIQQFHDVLFRYGSAPLAPAVLYGSAGLAIPNGIHLTVDVG